MKLDKEPKDYYGKDVLLKHLPTGELHQGRVVDWTYYGITILMNESAYIYLENDRKIDSRLAPKWEFIKIIEEKKGKKK